ncbi:MAG: class I SAM-dependent rRNA methyltransferase [Verrucomicrobiales bacterium]
MGQQGDEGLSGQARLKVRLMPAAEKAARGGHPWIYADRIKSLSRDGEAGELAIVYDRRDRFLGVGLFDPHSPIRLRMLHVGKPVTIDGRWWQARFAAATSRRFGMFDQGTTGYRWINGESDGLPGLVLDRYADTCVLKIYSSVWLGRIDEVLGWVTQACEPAPQTVVLRLSRNLQQLGADCFGRADGELLCGDAGARVVVFSENGRRFEADVVRGQKTGFFLDQRENRQRVGDLAKGRDVLNLFSHSGGFSIYAAAGGALSTTDVDISAHALAEAERNMALNLELAGVAACRHQVIRADAFKWLEDGVDEYDLVIIDPPSLARRQVERERALGAYRKLARAGLRRLRPGGILVAASCSAHVSADDFFAMIREVVRRGSRGWEELETHLHATDHEARIPEAHYLKAIYFRVTDGK